MALLFITHDLNLVRRFTHRVGVMERGKLVETGADRGGVRARRSTRYTQALLASRPQRVVAAGRRRRAGAASTRATSRVSFDDRAAAGSASAASTRCGARRCSCAAARRSASSANRARARRRSAWRCSRCSRSPRGEVDARRRSASTTPTATTLRAMRRRMQVVFQDPFGSLSPRMTIGRIVGEGLGAAPARARRAPSATRWSLQMLDEVGLERRAGRGRRAAALSARVLGRPAPAHRDRARGRAASRGARARRADLGARRLGAAPGAGAARRAAAPLRHELCLHQPRPRGRAGDVAPRPGDEGRRRSSRRATPRRCSRRRASPTRGSCSPPRTSPERGARAVGGVARASACRAGARRSAPRSARPCRRR